MQLYKFNTGKNRIHSEKVFFIKTQKGYLFWDKRF